MGLFGVLLVMVTNLYGKSDLIVDFVTEGPLYPKIKDDGNNAFEFISNHVSLSPEGERLQMIRGSLVAESNKDILTNHSKNYKEVEIYSAQRNSSIMSMQAYMLGFIGLEDGKTMTDVSMDLSQPPFKNKYARIDPKDQEISAMTKFGLKDGLTTFSYQFFGTESERF